MSPGRDTRLTPDELAALLRDARKAALATVDQDGFPLHLHVDEQLGGLG